MRLLVHELGFNHTRQFGLELAVLLNVESRFYRRFPTRKMHLGTRTHYGEQPVALLYSSNRLALV